jgi:hypothetical protein
MHTWARRDLIALALFALATVGLTWPLALHLGDNVVLGNRDVWPAIWQNWWLREVVTHGYRATFSPYLFHPTGLDVTYQPRRWTALGVWLPLAALFGDLAAFNLAAMLGIFLSAYATYALVVYLVGDRLAACFGGALFAFYPQHLWAALEQPNTGSIQWIPVFMLALIHALRTRKPLHLGLAAVTLALNWWLNLKIGVLAGLTGGLYVLYMLLVEGWWREATFWKAMVLFGVLSAALIAPVLYPAISGGERLQAAISLYEAERGADLLGYVVPAPRYDHPELPPLLRWAFGIEPINFRYRPFYLGLTAIWLAIIGAAGVRRGENDRRGVWLMMALIFFALSLGTVLVVAREPKPEVWLPYRLVADNILFRALRNPYRFSLALILPLGVLAGYGLARVRAWVGPQGRGKVAAVGLTTLLLVEIAQAPLQMHPTLASPFLWRNLPAEEGDFAVIDLPMGRDESKKYMYYQTLHGRPIAEGMIARMPPDAYNFIEANPLLAAWHSKEPLDCDAYDANLAARDLLDADFRYVIVHRVLWLERGRPVIDWVDGYFANIEPRYHDDFITVYALHDLADAPSPCD